MASSSKIASKSDVGPIFWPALPTMGYGFLGDDTNRLGIEDDEFYGLARFPSIETAGYVPDRILGQGAFGQVILARDMVFRRQVALKTLRHRPDQGYDAVSIARKEVEAMKKLHGIISVPEYYTSFVVNQGSRGWLYVIVMEYIDGPDLLEKFNEMQKMEIFWQPEFNKFMYSLSYWLFDTLRILHSMDLVHRDIKPENILVLHKPGGIMFYLIDMAFTCSFSSNRLLQVCDTSRYYGTLNFSAPEILRGPYLIEELKKADIWSAGVILWIFLNNKPFINFPRGLKFEAMREYYLDVIHLPRKCLYSPPFDIISLECTTIDPSLRPSAKEIVNFIERWKMGEIVKFIKEENYQAVELNSIAE